MDDTSKAYCSSLKLSLDSHDDRVFSWLDHDAEYFTLKAFISHTNIEDYDLSISTKKLHCEHAEYWKTEKDKKRNKHSKMINLKSWSFHFVPYINRRAIIHINFTTMDVESVKQVEPGYSVTDDIEAWAYENIGL
ncbi:hypothetical protein EJB05_05816 [Eragrostis curvula]|uniref:Uncharacterized protein n=1 Tax=Eragrostis curvula TaxID=38414 RepID=A0A5J9WFV2_9POAL|nr:hypothetical protein EJB05_05816 [Eragrostis curvula]